MPIEVPPEQPTTTAVTDGVRHPAPFPAPPEPDEATKREVLDSIFNGQSRMIGRYEYVRKLGAGGMGVVHLARDTKLPRMVAIKFVQNHALSPRSTDRLRREADTLAKLKHPNIVTVYDIGEHKGELFIAMEYVEGSTLDDWQLSSRRSLRELLQVYDGAAAGLWAAHQAGIVHRDFKPSNVLVGNDGSVRVADFGLAVDESRDSKGPTITSDGATQRTRGGTKGFMAPEVEADDVISDRADQFAFCVSMCEGLTRKLARESSDILTPVRPRWLRRILARGMNPDPLRRWADMEALRIRLNLDRRRRRWYASGLLGAGMTAGVILSFIFASESPVCPDPSATFDAVWSSGRQTALRNQLQDSDKAWIADLADVLESEIEAQRDGWISTRNELCRNTWVDKVRSEASLDRGNACLDRHLERIDLLLGLVAEADEESLAHLHIQLAALGDPGDCANETPRSSEERERPELAQEWRQLEVLKLRVAGGDQREALAEARALAARAAEWDAPLLHAETSYLMMMIEARLAPNQAIETGIQAELSAERAGADELRFEVQRRLVWVQMNFLDDAEAAHAWFDRADATYDRLGKPLRLAATRTSARAEIAAIDGDHETAVELLEDALEFAEDSKASPLQVDELELALANRLAEAGYSGAAISRYEKIVASREARLGKGHPEVATALFNLGITLADEGTGVEALLPLERAVEIREQVYGPISLPLEEPLVSTSQIHLELGNVDEALTRASRAHEIDIRFREASDPARLNGARLIAHAHLARGDYEAALAIDRLALELLDEGPDTSPLKVGIHYEIGWLSCRLGEYEQAAQHLKISVERGDAVVRRQAILAMADVHLARKRPELALRELDAVRPQGADDDLEFVAQHNWLEARALLASGNSRARVQALLDAAEAGYRRLPPRPDIIANLKELKNED